MPLIEVEEIVKTEGEQAAESRILHDRLFTKNTPKSDDGEEWRREATPAQHEEQIHRLDHDHLEIEKAKKRIRAARSRRQVMHAPCIPNSAAREIDQSIYPNDPPVSSHDEP